MVYSESIVSDSKEVDLSGSRNVSNKLSVGRRGQAK